MPIGRTNIGMRRNYITIQVATRTSDSQGGYTTAWADTYNEWARALTLSGSRILDQGGIKYRKAVEFTMRKRQDTGTDTYTLTGEHRIKWDSEYYTIHSVIPSEKLDDLKVLAYV
jgi:SPP1 family predicted phage head-tail adaptor